MLNNLVIVKNFLNNEQLKNLIYFRRKCLKKIKKKYFVDEWRFSIKQKKFKRYLEMNLSLNQWILLLNIKPAL